MLNSQDMSSEPRDTLGENIERRTEFMQKSQKKLGSPFRTTRVWLLNTAKVQHPVPVHFCCKMVGVKYPHYVDISQFEDLWTMAAVVPLVASREARRTCRPCVISSADATRASAAWSCSRAAPQEFDLELADEEMKIWLLEMENRWKYIETIWKYWNVETKSPRWIIKYDIEKQRSWQVTNFHPSATLRFCKLLPILRGSVGFI